MMPQTPGGAATLIAKLSPAIYPIAALCMVAQPLDQLFNLPAVDLSSVHWRFAAVGLLTTVAVLPLLGLLLALVTSLVCGHRWIYRITMTIAALAFILLTVGIGVFALDSLQVRSDFNPQLVRRFDITVVKAVIMQLAELTTLGLLLWTGARAGRALRRAAAAPAAADTLVMTGGRETVAP
jgi:hypothetical protein